MRKLLVGSAQYIFGPFGPDTDLRRYGLRLCERGGKNAKKRAAVAVARKLANLAAQDVGERRSIRAIAQQPPNDSCGSCVKTKRQDNVKIVPGREKQIKKPKAEFR